MEFEQLNQILDQLGVPVEQRPAFLQQVQFNMDRRPVARLGYKPNVITAEDPFGTYQGVKKEEEVAARQAMHSIGEATRVPIDPRLWGDSQFFPGVVRGLEQHKTLVQQAVGLSDDLDDWGGAEVGYLGMEPEIWMQSTVPVKQPQNAPKYEAPKQPAPAVTPTRTRSPYANPFAEADAVRAQYRDPAAAREQMVQEGSLHRVAPKAGELGRWST
jgi:hypothetical protein